MDLCGIPGAAVPPRAIGRCLVGEGRIPAPEGNRNDIHPGKPMDDGRHSGRLGISRGWAEHAE